ncbi:hypothetical protein BJF83_18735 [Nocardiopsis sp. CNR-923]|uniref:divisome protein SepX/GlpR n=1 Tax=Nocardiopsis sp. CNR-923 TaxID=1904965 RepID=UPI000969B77D|nr:hypothetical protein [Nocardiopsis sp. CNR-923]OLT27220.1 hypothetical protein BJF83_18735 [Nocardiopsis sp. CNR-923]
MSSSPLYLAIVVVWLIVLVPMLLRKDSVDTVHEDQRREDEWEPEEAERVEESDEVAAAVPEEGEDPDSEETQVLRRPVFGPAQDAGATVRRERPRAHPGRHRGSGGSRARVIARRRRRTTVLVLVNVATIVAVVVGLGPWWVITPPVLLLAGHLVLLREAAKADAERLETRIRARRRATLRARRAAREEERREAEREAQVIALRERRNQVYDQYADARLRAAGD